MYKYLEIEVFFNVDAIQFIGHERKGISKKKKKEVQIQIEWEKRET